MDVADRILVGLAPRTQTTGASLLRNHILPHVGETQHLGELIARWRNSGLGPATTLKLISLYRAWYRETRGEYPETRKWVRSVARELSRELNLWTLEECDRALNEAYQLNRPLYRRMLFTLHTGVRKSEMFAVRGRDLDFDNRVVYVHRRTKTGKPVAIPMTSKLHTMLLQLPRQPDASLFKHSCVTEQLKTFCRVARLPVITWHALRHLYATILLDSGVPLRQVSELLRHSRVSTTADIYWRNMRPQVNLDVLP